MWRGSVVAILLARVALVAGQSTGLPGCPCIEWSNLDSYLSGNQLRVQPAGENGQTYLYNDTYGSTQCAKWDENYPPYCASATGQVKADAPEWCNQQWCYVDRSNCDLALVYKSSYFPSENLYYSYTTCGSTNRFQRWVDEGNLNEENIMTLITTVEEYTRATRNTIETEYAAAAASGGLAGCTLTSGCACPACVDVDGWGNERVDFLDVMALTHSDMFRCLGNIIKDTYLRVANFEYQVATRIGYQYAADQVNGSYMQWPALAWCPANFGSRGVPGYDSSNYDPRFRDWYAGPASGPKDVTIVIDTSGSMDDYSRMSLAKAAAKQVLNTLTFVDFVTVVSFSSEATAASAKTLPATTAWKDVLKSFIDNLSPQGTTNFIAALNSAFSVFSSSRGNSCFSSGCNGALLFLSDGEADSWSDEDANRYRGMARDNQVTVFTFGLGARANMESLSQLAAGGDGFSERVADGGALGDAMSAYYLVFADLSRHQRIGERLRWVIYNDWITGEELTAGCMPFFDSRDDPPATNTAGMSLQQRLSATQGLPLLGVTCMDVNMIVNMEVLKNHSGFAAFLARIHADSRMCTNDRTPPSGPAPDSSQCRDQQASSRGPVTNAAQAWRPAAASLALAALALARS